MITLENDLSFDFCVSSGALGYDGRGWPWEQPLRLLGIINPKPFVVVAKTVTNEPRKGNLRWWRPWTCVRTLPGKGTTNAVGLTNPGIDYWLQNQLPKGVKKRYSIAPSVKPETSFEATRMANLLRQYDFPFVEVNLSCPNVEDVYDEIPEMLSELGKSSHSIILKLAIDQVNPSFIKTVDPLVNGYHAINTIPWDKVYPNQVSPIQKYKHGLKGGVSGPAIRNQSIESVKTLKTLTNKPIIGGGGIFCLDDVFEFKKAGAKAFSIGTCFLHRPWRPNLILKSYREKIDYMI